MNIIQNQVDEFTRRNLKHRDEYREFISEVQSHLYDYKKTSHKIEFVERCIFNTKLEYDDHLPHCTAKDKSKCPENVYYQNVLFFLQEELEELESYLPENDFTQIQKNNSREIIDQLVKELNDLKLGQQIIYDDFAQEFQELKEMYYLDKKNWKQLLLGKISEMIASGIISETASKSIVDIITTNYDKIMGR